MDYSFFALLTEKMEAAQGDEKARLLALREQLLEWVRQMDEQLTQKRQQVSQVIEALVQSEDLEKDLVQVLPEVDDVFVQVLGIELEAARQAGNLERLAKLQRIVEVLEAASAPPPELQFIQDLLEAGDDQAVQKLLEEQADKVTPEFMEMLTNVMMQSQNSEQPQLGERIQEIYRLALRFAMRAKMVAS
jgi:hypothetical protein